MTRIRYLLPLGLVWACSVDEPADSDEAIELPSLRSASSEGLLGDVPGVRRRSTKRFSKYIQMVRGTPNRRQPVQSNEEN